jgi:hypothetical protein
MRKYGRKDYTIFSPASRLKSDDGIGIAAKAGTMNQASVKSAQHFN